MGCIVYSWEYVFCAYVKSERIPALGTSVQLCITRPFDRLHAIILSLLFRSILIDDTLWS